MPTELIDLINENVPATTPDESQAITPAGLNEVLVAVNTAIDDVDGGGGGGGVDTFAELTDKATADIPTINGPTATALAAAKARANHTGTQPLSTLSQSGASTGQVAKWNGSAWAPAAETGGGSSGLISVNLVTDLGGEGDDSTDNTAALEEAMAMDATKYELVMPFGVYKSHVVDINPQLNIIGGGMDMWNDSPSLIRGTVIKSMSAEPVFRYIVNDYITNHVGRIEGIQFDGAGIGTIGWDLEGVFNFYFHRCGFKNFTSSGVKLRGSLIGTFHKCLFLDNEYDIDMGAKTYTSHGAMPPNLIQIIDCKAQGTKKYCFLKNGGSTLFITGGDFERCGTDGQDSGVVKIIGSTEGLGLVFRNNYVERTAGFATINIQAAAEDEMQYIIADTQMNAAGTALHDIYIDASGANKQEVRISNTLAKNAGGLTVVGTNAFLHLENAKFNSRTIPSGVKVVEVTNDAEILVNGVAVGAGGLQQLDDAGALALVGGDPVNYYNTDAGELQHFDGADWFTVDKTPYTPTGPLIYDDFNRADNASSLGSSVVPATAWPTPSGTWGIQSNEAYCPSLTPGGGTVSYMATRDAGVSDFTLIANMKMASNSAGGVVFRHLNDSNTLSVDCYIVGGVSGFDVYKTVANIRTLVLAGPSANPGPIAPGVAFQLIVDCSGDSIDVSLDGTPISTITESTFNTATGAGMLATQAASVGNPVKFVDFTVNA